ncbi:hypothetical protein PVAR5_8849 [Paecilomyces variotii No. 5]|uniref:Uncharacterized protein n=1 Tax=Byssochlamys spectabilis (strain No. 5 / NBRC 109023) TaxID=1356009 RepID=V5GGP5_BYSSN|nr:hypothetical protein PVAR5_8849 [Paecilomyces variotii No. 5]
MARLIPFLLPGVKTGLTPPGSAVIVLDRCFIPLAGPGPGQLSLAAGSLARLLRPGLRPDAKSGLLSSSTSCALLQRRLSPFQDRSSISQKSRDR